MSYKRQISTVLAIEIGILTVLAGSSYLFWTSVCDQGTWASCVGTGQKGAWLFFLYALIRPILATPVFVLALIAGDAFGPFLGMLLTALGVSFSAALLYIPGKWVGKIFVRPFLTSNLPAMSKLIRTQDYKVVFASRWFPLLPFDILSFAFGALDFRFKSTFWATFFGILPQCYFFAQMGGAPDASMVGNTITSISIFGLIVFVPLFVYEFLSRKKGTSLFARLTSVYREILYEVRVHNAPVENNKVSKGGKPVLLLYGFFSSRRVLTIQERVLKNQGKEVLSFNLGGFFGVFFTHGIEESALILDRKIRRKMGQYDFNELEIIAHSKGGLVAMYWLMKMNGHRYCKKVITLGTPFGGSYHTYLGLVTPLGLFWKDLWQMRPGSEFLHELRNSPVPDDLEVLCLYSDSDNISRNENAIFQPIALKDRHKIKAVLCQNVHHLEFLHRREVTEKVLLLLDEPTPHNQPENKSTAYG